MVSLRTQVIFLRPLFFSAAIFGIPSEKQIKFVTSTTATAVQSKSDSHVNVYYQPVVSSPLFVLCVRCFVFEEEKELP